MNSVYWEKYGGQCGEAGQIYRYIMPDIDCFPNDLPTVIVFLYLNDNTTGCIIKQSIRVKMSN